MTEMLAVNEVYTRPTVQGEGPHSGRVCTFVRLYGCNLHCSWCDTPYTWDTKGRNGTVFPIAQERHLMSIADVANAVYDVGVPLCVISGGEPLIQYPKVIALARLLADASIETHVETNGTIWPDRDEDVIAHYTVSPKLPSADAGDKAMRLDILHEWAKHPRAIFKTVISRHHDVMAIAGIYDILEVRPAARWVMPEATTAAELDERLGDVIDTAAVLYGLNVSTRLHVHAWGTTRGR